MACAALSRRAIDGPWMVDLRNFCVVHIFCRITYIDALYGNDLISLYQLSSVYTCTTASH